MQTFKFAQTRTKEVVASLDCIGISKRRHIGKIQSWIKDLSHGHCSVKVECKSSNGLYILVFSSDSKEWEAYHTSNEFVDAIYIAHTTTETEIVPDTTDFARELIEKITKE